MNENDFCNALSEIDWNTAYNAQDVKLSLVAFESLFSSVCNIYAPVRKNRVRNNKSPWIDVEILDLIHERNYLKKIAIKSESKEDWKTFKKMKNYVTTRIKSNKRIKFQEKIKHSNGNLGQTWRNLNLLIPRKKKGNKLTSLKIDSEEINDAQLIAHELNEYFINVGPDLASKIISDVNETDSQCHVTPPPLACHFELMTVISVICQN